MKNFKLLLAVFAVFAILASACGDDDSDDVSANVATTDTTAATEEPAAEPAPATTEAPPEEAPAEETPAQEVPTDEAPTGDTPAVEGITIWADDTRAPVFAEFGEDFTAETGVPVTVVEVEFGQIRENIVQQAAAGEGADIIIGAHDWLGELVQSGVVAPIDLPNSAEYEQVGLNAFTFEGQLYGVPVAIENIGLFRNTDLVPEPVTDWNELISIGGGLLDEGAIDVVVAVQNTPDPDVYHNYPLQTMFGSYIFGTNADGTYNPTDLGIASDAGKAYAAAWKEWNGSGIIDATLDPDTAKQAFTEGRAAFYITGPWNLADLRDSGIPFAIDAFPTLAGTQGAPFVGVQGIMVNSFSENALLAQAFATDYMATQNAQLKLFELGGRAPAHTAALIEAAAADADLGGFGAAGAAGQPLPAIPEMGAVWGNLANGYKLILDGVDPAEAFQEAQDLIFEAITE